MKSLPQYDVLDPAFENEARECDRCSSSPDNFTGTGGKNVYIGSACYAHDLHYAWIDREVPWYKYKTFLRMKRRADRLLRDNIIKLGRRAGEDLEELADVYYIAVRTFNPVHRLIEIFGGKTGGK